MPLATIQIYTGWTAQQKQQLLDSLQKAILESLAVPEDDLQLTIQEQGYCSRQGSEKHYSKVYYFGYCCI